MRNLLDKLLATIADERNARAVDDAFFWFAVGTLSAVVFFLFRG